MIKIKKVLNTTINNNFLLNYNINEVVFFDIETTGFTAKSTILYLIGCVYYEEGAFNLIQWFADDINSETQILHSFFNFINKYKFLFHYNGTGFDIPYILKKCSQHNLSYNFNNLESFDIYKKIMPYKKILKLANLKQKNIEDFLGIQRIDKYSGGELIEEYYKYLQFKDRSETRSKELFDSLILHNQEDLQGMVEILPILSYNYLFTGNYEITNIILDDNYLIINMCLLSYLPKRIQFSNELFFISGFKDNITIKVKLYKNELKFFYSNYNDYYYLPIEDKVIHKSVAFYVDKNFRAKAKAANCYSKKTGNFIPQFEEIVTPYFKIDFFDKITYFETINEVINEHTLMKTYIDHILKYVLK